MRKKNKRPMIGNEIGFDGSKKQSHGFKDQTIISDGNVNDKSIISEQIKATSFSYKNKDSIIKEMNENWLKFYTNNFKIENDDYLESIRREIGFSLYITGSFCLAKMESDDRFIIGSLKNIKRDIYGEIKTATFVPKFDKQRQMPVEYKDIVIMYANWWKIPMVTYLHTFFNLIVDSLDFVETDIQNAFVKNIAVINDIDLENEKKINEIANVFSNNKNNVVVSNKKFEVQQIKTESINELLWNNVKEWWNFLCMMRGRPVNISEKDERNVKAEVEVNSSVFETSLNDYYWAIENFVLEYNKKFNRTAKFVPLLNNQNVKDDKEVEVDKDVKE